MLLSHAMCPLEYHTLLLSHTAATQPLFTPTNTIDMGLKGPDTVLISGSSVIIGMQPFSDLCFGPI